MPPSTFRTCSLHCASDQSLLHGHSAHRQVAGGNGQSGSESVVQQHKDSEIPGYLEENPFTRKERWELENPHRGVNE
jgi:hypothetical protein